MNWRMLCTILVIGVLASAASGEVPRLISYQGFLMESPTGPPLQGQYDIVFAIYAASSGGTALWTESHTAVSVNRGVFSVNLGSLQPLSNGLFVDGERWLNVYVPNIAIGLPRTRITSGVWALRASVADTALAFAGSVPPHAHALDEMTDVDAASPQSGEVLTWDGDAWAAMPTLSGIDDPRIYAKLRLPEVAVPLSGVSTVEELDFVAPTDGYIVCTISFVSAINTGGGPFCWKLHRADFSITLNGQEPLGSLGVFEIHNVPEYTNYAFSIMNIRTQAAFPVQAGSNNLALVASASGSADTGCTAHKVSKVGIWAQFFPIGTANVEIVE